MRWMISPVCLVLLVAVIPATAAAQGPGPGQGGPPPHGGGMQSPHHEGNVLHLETNSFRVDILTDRAEVVYGYPSSREPPYHLHFINLIGYNDTGEAGYQRNEALFKAPLDGLWQAGQVVKDENDELGPFITFSMSREVDFHTVGDPRERINGAATLTLHFLLATNSFTESLDSGVSYEVQGSAELKIDIEITLHKELPFEDLTVEQVLFNEPPQGERDRFFQTEEARHQQRLLPGFNDTNEHRFEDRQAGHQHIGMVNTEELEEGFYNWVSQVELGRDQTTQLENVTTTYATDGSGLRIYLSYPILTNLTSIYHDPSVGMVAANLPQMIEEAARDLLELVLSFGLGGLLAVGFIVAATFAAVGRKEGD